MYVCVFLYTYDNWAIFIDLASNRSGKRSISSLEIHKLKTIIEVSIVVSCCFSRWNIRDEDLFGGRD